MTTESTTKHLYLIEATDVGEDLAFKLEIITHQLSIASATQVVLEGKPTGIYEYRINPHPAILDGKATLVLKASDFDVPDAREVGGKLRVSLFTYRPEEWQQELKRQFPDEAF